MRDPHLYSLLKEIKQGCIVVPYLFILLGKAFNAKIH